jgi:hypothetical protein
MSEIELLQQISEKMDKLLRLQALSLVKEISEEQGKIELLDSLGFRPIDIAKLLSKTPENINVVLSSIRRKKGEKKTKSTGKPQVAVNTSEDATKINQLDTEASKK